ncbi:MAG: hypothetical protein ACTSRE_15265 [Promethearchaeota archaeon]
MSNHRDPFEKIRLELKTMWRIHKLGIHPIDALDQLMTHAFEIARSEIINRNSNANKKEIEMELRQRAKQDLSLKKKINQKKFGDSA